MNEAGVAINSIHDEVLLLEFSNIVVNLASTDPRFKLAFLVLELCDFVFAGTISLSADSCVESKIFGDGALGGKLHF